MPRRFEADRPVDFGADFLSASCRQSQDHSFELGLPQFGTLPGRDRDTIAGPAGGA